MQPGNLDVTVSDPASRAQGAAKWALDVKMTAAQFRQQVTVARDEARPPLNVEEWWRDHLDELDGPDAEALAETSDQRAAQPRDAMLASG